MTTDYDKGTVADIWIRGNLEPVRAMLVQRVYDDKKLWCSVNGNMHEAHNLQRVEVVPAASKDVDLSDIIDRLESVRRSLEVLTPFFGGRQHGKTTLSSAWDVLSDVVTSLVSVSTQKTDDDSLPEPLNYGAIVTVRRAVGKETRVARAQRDEAGYWVMNGDRYQWSDFHGCAVKVEFDGIG